MPSERAILLAVRLLDPRRLGTRLRQLGAALAFFVTIWFLAVRRAGGAVERRGRSHERRRADAHERLRAHERRWFRLQQQVERELVDEPANPQVRRLRDG